LHGAEELDGVGAVDGGGGLGAGGDGGEVAGLDVRGLVDAGGDAVGEEGDEL